MPRIVVWLAGATLLSFPALALERNAALGASGEIYQAKAGLYRSLFPSGQDAPAPNPVLALEITRPGGKTERLLVPGTEGQDQDQSPALVFEPSSNTLFLVWEHRLNTIHSVLRLVGFDGTRWTQPLLLSSNPFSAKVAPQLTVARDSYQDVATSLNPVTRHRMVLQLLWEEENQEGSFDVFYSPVIFENGSYLGWNPVYNLSLLAAVDESQQQRAEVSEPVAELINAPVIQAGRDSRTAVIAFVLASTRRLVTVEVDLLPEELGRLAEKLRLHIIDMGARHDDRQTMAQNVKQALLAEDTALAPEVLSYLATQVHDEIVESADQPLDALSRKLRMHIIDMGARLSGRGLRPSTGTAKSEEIARSFAEGDDSAVPPHWIQLRTASSWPAPGVGAGQLRLFVSESGSDVLVSWADSNKVLYRSTTEDGWTDVKQVQISGTLSLDEAYQLLERKVRNR